MRRVRAKGVNGYFPQQKHWPIGDFAFTETYEQKDVFTEADVKRLAKDDGLTYDEMLAVVCYCNYTKMCAELRSIHRAGNESRFPRWNTHLSRAIAKLYLFDDANDAVRAYNSLTNANKFTTMHPFADVDGCSSSPVLQQNMTQAPPFFHGLNGLDGVLFTEAWRQTNPGQYDEEEFCAFEYRGPVSMSRNRDKAIMFASGQGGTVPDPADHGLLLSLTQKPQRTSSGYYGTHFAERGFTAVGADVSWISFYPDEEEVLFLDPVFALSDNINQPEEIRVGSCVVQAYRCSNIVSSVKENIDIHC